MLDRKPTSLGRETGWQLKNGPNLENEATYQYSATTGRLETVANSADVFTYGYLTNSSLLNTVTIFKTDRNYQESYLRFQSLSFDYLFASQMLSSSNRMIYLCRARAGDAAD